MGKSDEIALQLADIHRKAHEAEKQKQLILTKINAIKDLCVNRDISYSEYEERLGEKVQDKSLTEWVEYYDKYIDHCQNLIENRR